MLWNRSEGSQPRPAGGPTAGGRVERASPGLAAFFAGVDESGSHAVLDLGKATPAALAVYTPYARWIRFADVLDQPSQLAASLERIATSGRVFDLLLVWDLLDRVHEGERMAMVERLARMAAPGARLFLVVRSTSDGAPAQFVPGLAGPDRMSLEPTGVAVAPGARLLPAEVQRVLSPFEVVRGFTADIGLREYFAVFPRLTLVSPDPRQLEEPTASRSS